MDQDESNVAEAIEIAKDRDRGATLEALVLSRLEPHHVASRLKLPLRIVEAYEALFFDIRDLLQIREYIFRKCITPEWQTDPPESARRRVAMKILAFLSGPQSLDDIFEMNGTLSNRWRRPSEVVQRLATEYSVSQIADLLPHPGGRQGPLSLGPVLAAICELLDKQSGNNYPSHIVEYTFRNFSYTDELHFDKGGTP